MGAYGASYHRASYDHTAGATVHHERHVYGSPYAPGHIVRDADHYADFLDRELRLSGRQERDIERLLIDRTNEFLGRTRARDHHRIYPFPRHERTHTTRQWWDETDHYIDRMLNPHQRYEYQRIKYSFHGSRYGR